MPHHDTPLVATIAVGLVLAFCLGFLARRLRLPPLVGYLLAGVAVGPFTPGFVADADLAPQLAELGVILLMFGVGIHFSIKDLLAVRKVAIPGAVGQIAIALGAFLAGLTVSESDLGHRAAEEALPLRDAFAVLFFVSVGMLFDPAVLVEQPLQVLVVVGIIVVGKS